MQEVPRIERMEQISLEWLTAVLERAGVLTGGLRLSGFRLEDLKGVSLGYMSGMVRIHLSYAGEGAKAPASLVAKLPPREGERFALGASFNLFEREMCFYRDIASRTVIRVPKCYYAAYGESPDSALVILEDAGDWSRVDQIEGLSRAKAEATLDMIAALHARWWEAPALKEFEWLPDSPWDPEHMFREAWPGFVALYQPWLTAKQFRLGEGLAASGPAMKRALKQPPGTLAHCDVRADNMLLDGPAGNEPVMLLDWQTIARTKGALDAARLVCGSLALPLAKGDFLDFARRWHGRLVELGVEGYAEDEAWRDFRIGILNALYVPVCFHINITHEGGRAFSLLEAQVKRMFHAVVTCDALSALEGV